MDYKVSTASIVAIIFSLAIAFIVPIGLCIYMKVRKKARLSSFFLGCGTFIVFALILEQILHAVVLTATGTLLTDHIFLFALYGGLCAGLFEETGRFLTMKFIMKEKLDRKNALMYGVGHGGIEAIIIIGIAYISNLVMAFMINQGVIAATVAESEMSDALLQGIQQLCELPAYQFCMAGIERISAIVLHIILSYLIYLAVKNSNVKYYLIAVGLHLLIDAGTIILAKYVDVVIVEIILLVSTGVIGAILLKNADRIEDKKTQGD